MPVSIHLTGPTCYRLHKNSKWVEISLNCKRCNETIWREVLDTGQKTYHFCCSRSGCTWADYRTEDEWDEFLSICQKRDIL